MTESPKIYQEATTENYVREKTEHDTWENIVQLYKVVFHEIIQVFIKLNNLQNFIQNKIYKILYNLHI